MSDSSSSSSSSSSSCSSLESLAMADAGSKYFMVKSEMNGLVLDVKGGDADVGTKVITWEAKDSDFDNQVFFEHPMTGTLRPKHAPHLIVAVPDDGNNTAQLCEAGCCQCWCTGDDGFVCCKDERVLDVAAAEQAPGARICAWTKTGNENQKWTYVYQPRQYFYIQSKFNNLVLDIKAGNADPGAEVVTWEKKDDGSSNQLWYEDRHGYIRSKLNDLVLDTSSGKLRTAVFAEGSEHQRWCLDGERVANPALEGQVLDIKAAEMEHGAEVIPYGAHGGANQQWEAVYV